MKPLRPANRRSFLVRVGAVATAGAALALVGGSEVLAQNNYSGVTDCDSGNNHDRPGYGVGNRNQYTDQDTGPGSDPRCRGRGSNTGANSGTQYHPDQPMTRCSDNDYGRYGDPGGRGRRCRGLDPNYSGQPRYSGCSDNDPSNGGDSIGNGRRCTPR